GQREQRVALGAGWKRVQRFLGPFSELLCSPVRVVNRGVSPELAQQRLPLFGRHCAGRDDIPYDAGTDAVVRLPQQMYQRERQLPFAQIAANRLADRVGVSREVQQVVDDLKSDAQVEPVVAQRLLTISIHAAEHPTNLRATAEQVSRLPTNDLEVLVFSDIGVAVLRQLVQLPLDHPQRDVAQHADDLQRVVSQRQRHRLDVQVVAKEHRDVVAPARVNGQAAAPQIGIVDDVVVDERGSVYELDNGSVKDRAIAFVAAQPGRHQQHGGPNPLAAARLNVLTDL